MSRDVINRMVYRNTFSVFCAVSFSLTGNFVVFQPESFYHGTINIGDTVALGLQKREATTEVEKLFYQSMTFKIYKEADFSFLSISHHPFSFYPLSYLSLSLSSPSFPSPLSLDTVEFRKQAHPSILQREFSARVYTHPCISPQAYTWIGTPHSTIACFLLLTFFVMILIKTGHSLIFLTFS